jgi:predicted transcriptional regulator of viral defense system
MKELRDAGVQTRDISSLVTGGIIEKVKPGLYKLIDYPWDEHESFADVCNSNKNAVICLLSAASYYELTTFSPKEIYVSIPHNTDRFFIKYPPIKVYYFIEKYYKPGIEEFETPSGKIKIYNKEKSIGDLFRYIKKLGEDVVLESLKTYMGSSDRNIAKLHEYSVICGVKDKMEPFIKSML